MLATLPSTSHADDTVVEAAPLKDLLKAAGAKPTRFVLKNGKTVIGRIVRIDDDGFLIRRPSAGLLPLPLTDIAEIKIKAPDGAFLPGRITRLAEGGLGWVAEGSNGGSPERDVAAVENDAPVDSGGPLIRVEDDSETGQTAATGSDGDNQVIALAPATSDPAPARQPLGLSVEASRIEEGDELALFRLKLSAPATHPIPIIYTMINGTAVAPGDYIHRQGVVVFEPGQTEAVVTTRIVNDEVAEGAESFAFFVTGDPATVRIDERKIAATIEDNDG